MAKQANIRFYIDEDTLGLAKLLTRVRSDVTYPGDPGGIVDKRERPPCDIARGALDTDWIPTVASRGWLVITRDRQIEHRTAEKAAIRSAGGRHVALTSRGNLGRFEILEAAMCQWRKIEELTELPGPFIYAATRTTFRKVDKF